MLPKINPTNTQAWLLLKRHFTEEMQQAIPDVILTLQNLSSAGSTELINFKPLYGDTLIEEKTDA